MQAGRGGCSGRCGSRERVPPKRAALACVLSLHVRNLPLYDYREALRPPTRFVPLEEESTRKKVKRRLAAPFVF